MKILPTVNDTSDHLMKILPTAKDTSDRVRKKNLLRRDPCYFELAQQQHIYPCNVMDAKTSHSFVKTS